MRRTPGADTDSLCESRGEIADSAAIQRLRATHLALESALKGATSEIARERLPYHLGHDCYHLGQIMYLRALQGLDPIE